MVDFAQVAPEYAVGIANSTRRRERCMDDGPIAIRAQRPCMDIENAERVLSQSPDHRVLRRVPPPADWGLSAASEAGDLRRAVYVDVETTGLDQERDEVIELAILPFDYARETGDIVRVYPDDALNAF